MDWSAAMGKAFIRAMLHRANHRLGNPSLKAKDVAPFFRMCEVHFKRSFTQILQNGAVVKPDEEEEFRKLVNKLLAGDTLFERFS